MRIVHFNHQAVWLPPPMRSLVEVEVVPTEAEGAPPPNRAAAAAQRGAAAALNHGARAPL